MDRCRLYSPAQVGMATLFGSVLAGTVLIAPNARRLEQTALAWKALAVGVVMLVLLSLAAIVLTESGTTVVAGVPNLPFAVALALIAHGIHREEYRKHLPEDAIRAACVAIFFVPVPFVIFFVVCFLTR